MADVVIAAAVRSAVGRANKGALAYTRPDELAGQVIRAVLAKVPGLKASDVDDLVLGCAMPEGEQGLNVARVAGLLGGLPIESGAITINRFCSSGLQAIAQAAERVAFGSADVIVAGGVESMSRVPMGSSGLGADVSGTRLTERYPDGLVPQGIAAELIAARYGISRSAQDSFALSSQQRAASARDNGWFDSEIVPLKVTDNDGASVEVAIDEGIRASTPDGLACDS
jgi:acetyl-CoA acyltransferase